METKKCEVCGQILPQSAFSKSYKGRCKECVAKQTREKRKGIVAIDKPRQIDWEQRRYEIAKDMLKAIYIDEGNESRASQTIEFEYQDMNSCAYEAIRWADVLIEELKKTHQ